MGKTAKKRKLAVWMNGMRVGRWSILAGGRQEFIYDGAWLDSPDARPLSLSLPLVPENAVRSGSSVESFFDNLLPDSTELRRRIQRRFGTASTSPFDLLAETGRDCVGAIQLLPEGEEPRGFRSIDAEPLDDAGVAAILRNAVSLPFPGQAADDDFRISIAGAQEKTALLLHDGRWCRPRGSTPTTHIFKLPLGRVGGMQADMSGSVENEWLCSRIVEAFGIRIARTEMAAFEGRKVLVVERFDRKLSSDGSWLIRLPQEDMCQAMGIPPDAKYESEGGPGISRILQLLLGARDAFADRRSFFKSQVLFWILGAPDGHAKNFSVFIEPRGRYSLTPLYDVMSAYPVMGHGAGQLPPEKLRMAMAVTGKNRHYEWTSIARRHWLSTAQACDAGPEAEDIISELIARTPEAIRIVSASLPDGFPDSVAGPIFDGMLKAVARLAEGK
ncbi:MAG: type II toxin-antitoxin system HipA family toxin [Rectinemataceae bacterium]|nr:type II toxin-antitoxin system HipA family toxin [Rectinemataceae bacterium]